MATATSIRRELVKLNETNDGIEARLMSRATGNVLVSYGGEDGMSDEEIDMAVAGAAEDTEDYYLDVRDAATGRKIAEV